MEAPVHPTIVVDIMGAPAVYVMLPAGLSLGKSPIRAQDSSVMSVTPP